MVGDGENSAENLKGVIYESSATIPGACWAMDELITSRNVIRAPKHSISTTSPPPTCLQYRESVGIASVIHEACPMSPAR